jgi:5-methylcytosine-specific restriction endonuclease McrA
VDADGHQSGSPVVDAVIQKAAEEVEAHSGEVEQGLKEIAAATSAAARQEFLASVGALVKVATVPAIIITYLIDPNGGHACGNGCDTLKLPNQGDTRLGEARGAGEEKSQSDDATDRARTNGGLAKPNKGPGSVPKEERDPKRTWTPAENQRKLDQQKGRCANCGKPIQPGQGVGHHVNRHADGGNTNDPNHAVVCKPCHVDDLHK